jgi:hypothetical protein
MLFMAVNTTLKPKTATDYSSPKVGLSSTQMQHSLYPLVGAKHSFLQLKLAVRSVISFTRKYLSKKMTFYVENDSSFLSWGGV